MRESVTLTVKIDTKLLNQFLALAGENVIITDEQLDEYDNLVFDTNKVKDLEGEQKIAAAALLYMAKAEQISNQ